MLHWPPGRWQLFVWGCCIMASLQETTNPWRKLFRSSAGEVFITHNWLFKMVRHSKKFVISISTPITRALMLNPFPSNSCETAECWSGKVDDICECRWETCTPYAHAGMSVSALTYGWPLDPHCLLDSNVCPGMGSTPSPTASMGWQEWFRYGWITDESRR